MSQQHAAERVRLSDVLQSERDAILSDWEEQARQLPGADSLERARFLDSLPNLLDEIVGLVRGAEAQAPGERPVRIPRRIPDLHAINRLDVGYDLRSVVAEYRLLRTVLMRRVGSRPFELEARVLLHEAVDVAIEQAVARFNDARDRTFAAFDRIAAEPLGERELPDYLERLLRMLVETSPAVDVGALLLRQQERLFARASVGFSLGGEFSVAIGEGFVGQVAAEAKPLMVRSALDARVVHPELKRLGVRAMYGIPLEHQGRMIGVALMGSLTAWDFSDEDQQIFRSVARRATSLIFKAELIERDRAARRVVEASKAILDTLLAAAPIGVAYLDRDLRFIHANAALAEMNGSRIEEHLGRSVRDVLPEDAAGVVPILERVLDGEEVRNLEIRFPDRGPGRPARVFLANYFPVRTPDGEVIGVGAAVVDITERERRERELRQAAEILELGDAFFTLDFEFRITRVNVNQEKLSQTTRAQTLGRSFWEVWPEAAAPDLQFRRMYEKAMHQRVPVAFEEFFAPLQMWTEVTAYPTEDGIAVFFREVTQRKRVEEELRSAIQFKDRFLGIVGHDLRNPLNAIQMSAAMLNHALADNPRLQRNAGRILNASERMGRMISDVLDFTRGRLGGGIPVTRRDSDMAEIVREVVAEAGATRPDREVALEIHGETHGRWDTDRVAQAIGNLVINALKYGDPEAPIRLHVEGRPDEVVVSVWNGGSPIAPERLPTVFEPFSQGARTGASEGLGLGLFIVCEIVRAHGGRASARSSAEEGTTFTTEWPRS